MTKRAPKNPIKMRIANADALGSRWLANGNDALERGETERAAECFRRGQFWIDRSNLLRGCGDRPAPKE